MTLLQMTFLPATPGVAQDHQGDWAFFKDLTLNKLGLWFKDLPWISAAHFDITLQSVSIREGKWPVLADQGEYEDWFDITGQRFFHGGNVNIRMSKHMMKSS